MNNLSNRFGSNFKTENLKDSSSDAAETTAVSVVMHSSSVFTVRGAVLLLFFVISISIGSLHIIHVSSSTFTHIIPSCINPSASLPEEIEIEEPKLEDVLRRAETRDNKVILTTLNEAWAAPASVLDLFFESFEIGQGTRQLLKHLVIIALDAKAYSLCLDVHKHCFSLVTEGVDFSSGEAYFMTPYLKMMCRRRLVCDLKSFTFALIRF